MDINAQRYTATGNDEPTAVRLTLSSQDLKNLQKDVVPAAYIINSEDLPNLRNFTDCILDRGIKDNRKGLAAILLGYTQIPLIETLYTSTGKLASGIRKFLKKAADDRNIYILSVPSSVFSQLQTAIDNTVTLHDAALTAALPDPKTIRPLLSKPLNQKILTEEAVTGFIGNSPETRNIRNLIVYASQTASPVLIMGDTGTGKEVIAREIHRFSPRHNHQIKAVNCGAFSKELLELELFGIEAGVVTTGYQKRIGLWEDVGSGTLFLDEIGDLSLYHQVKILRALSENVIRRVGGTKDIKVNARIIAATNRDLRMMMDTGQFRKDLYYRLHVFPIHTTVLRDRPDDIAILANHFWKKITADDSVELPPEIIKILEAYAWPGNVRQLMLVLDCLFSLYHEETDNLHLGHLKNIFQVQGLTWPASQVNNTTTAKEKQSMGDRLESLRYLQRVIKEVRATEVAIEPMTKDQKTDFATTADVYSVLQFRIDTLELLCHHPLRFSPSTFEMVDGLRSKLVYFRSLLQKDPEAALLHWRTNSASVFSDVLTKITDDTAELLSIH